MNCEFFIDDNFLGSGTVTETSPTNESLAFYCPSCGEVWARICVPDSKWFFERHYCARCWRSRPDFSDGVELFGPIVSATKSWVTDFPIEILKRDFLILMELHDDRTIQTP